MKKYLPCLIACAASLCIPDVHAQVWVPVGSVAFSAGGANGPSLALDRNDVPYLAFGDGSFFTSEPTTVMKYNGSGWVIVGNAGFADSTAVTASIAIDSAGTPYVTYMVMASHHITCKKFNGSSWVTVGNRGFTGDSARLNYMTVDRNGKPYVIYQDYANGQRASVMSYNGSAWSLVGPAGFTSGFTQGGRWIATDRNGTPYMAYQDLANSGRATVRKFNGSNWVPVGNPGFSIGAASGASITIDRNGTPYVVYTDYGNAKKASVMKFNGTAWVNVGSTPGISPGEVYYPALAIDSAGTPYLAYAEPTMAGGKAIVLKYDSASGWTNAGNAYFSDSLAQFLDIAIDRKGTPYVSYTDWGHGFKATVMKLLDTTTHPDPTGAADLKKNNAAVPSLSIFPDPSHGSFTVSISASQTEKTTVIITDLMGEKVKEVVTNTNQSTYIQLDSPPGVYLISAITSQGRTSGTVIIQ